MLQTPEAAPHSPRSRPSPVRPSAPYSSRPSCQKELPRCIWEPREDRRLTPKSTRLGLELEGPSPPPASSASASLVETRTPLALLNFAVDMYLLRPSGLGRTAPAHQGGHFLVRVRRETWTRATPPSLTSLAGLASSSSSPWGTRKVCGSETTLPSFLRNQTLCIHSEHHFPPGASLHPVGGRRTKWCEPVVLKLRCILEPPLELSNIPLPGHHPRPTASESPRNGIQTSEFFKLPVGIAKGLKTENQRTEIPAETG